MENETTRVVDLPSLVWTVQPWRERAACIGYSVDMFFDVVNDGARSAKAVCDSCPVQFECLEWACDTGEQHGIFGGKSPRERSRYRTYKEGVTNWKLCGTSRGIKEHDAKGEPQCGACKAASAEIARKRKNKEASKARHTKAHK
jgi:WhiB family redox-sensing transcriptional regulator